MAIRNRRGVYSDFDKTKMVDGEFAVVKSGDPDGSGKAVYMSFQSGTADRLALFDDLEEYGGKIDTITANGEELPIVDKTVDIPIPTVDISAPAGEIVEFSTGGDNMPMKAVEVSMSPIQDLNGYSSPWPAGGGKNKLPTLSLANIKSLNTSGTWSNNVYTLYGLSFTFAVIGDAVDSITISGTTTSRTDVRFIVTTFAAESYILNGVPTAISEAGLYISGGGLSGRKYDFGDGVNITLTTASATIAFGANANVTLNNLVIRPMLRLATETDPTYAPYSNICPISGRTGASVVVSGKNLFVDKGQGYWRASDGAFITSGTTAQTYRSCEKIPVIAGAQYAGFVKSTYEQPTNVYVQWWKADGTGREVRITQWPIVAPEDAVLMSYAFRFASTTIASEAVNVIQVEQSDTATEYKANTTTTYPIAFTSAGTVYAGTVDLVSGVLTVTHTGFTIDETMNINLESTRFYVGRDNCKRQTDYTPETLRCDRLPTVAYEGEINFDSPGVTAYRLRSNYPGRNWIYFSSGDSGITTVAQMKEWLADNPLQVVYELVEPLTYNLTPTQVKSLLGENVVWSPDGTISNLKYSADISLVVADLYSKLSS